MEFAHMTSRSCSHADAGAPKTSVSQSSSLSRQPGAERDHVTQHFIDFLKTFQRPGYDIFKQCHAFVENIAHKKVRNKYAGVFQHPCFGSNKGHILY